MNRTDRSGHSEVRRALKDLRARTAANLRAFNSAVPHASWLRRSEIERFTGDLSWSAERAPQRRWRAPFRRVMDAISRMRR